MIGLKAKHLLNVGLLASRFIGKRTVLTESYYCHEEWEKRLASPLLRNLKMAQYFIETDKKLNQKNAVSGIDIDLFANNVQDASQLEELEHLLYRFRKTKRSVELMDSTACATVRVYLKFKNYEDLFHVLKVPESYGIFPDHYSYNILMDTFIKAKMYKEATETAILMMLQEDFSNQLNCILAIYSCQMFLKNCSLESLTPQEVTEDKGNENEDEDEEEQLIRVPFLRNPFFDDHFHLTKPEHLIGKTFFLAGRQLSKEPIGATFQLCGLALYKKWDKLMEIANALLETNEKPLLISEGVEEISKLVLSLQDEKIKQNLTDVIAKLQSSNKVLPGGLEDHLDKRLKHISALEEVDIATQKELFQEWEKKRVLAVKNQNLILDKERRLEEIAKKKEYLYWKEKLLFFFENKSKLLDEYQKAQEVESDMKSKLSEEDQYVPPEIIRKATPRLTRYQRLSKVKQL